MRTKVSEARAAQAGQGVKGDTLLQRATAAAAVRLEARVSYKTHHHTHSTLARINTHTRAQARARLLPLWIPCEVQGAQSSVCTCVCVCVCVCVSSQRKKVVYVDDDGNVIGTQAEEEAAEDVTDKPLFSLTLGETDTVSDT